MGQAYFYHLTDTPLEATLPMLIEKARSAGWRVAVRGPEAALEALDMALWAGAEDSFLPHGIAGGAHDALQPVVLCGPDQVAANDAACLMVVSGAPVSAADVDGYKRVCVLFDGLDSGAVSQARGHWKAVTDAGQAALYWAQEDGRWVKKAESGVSA